MNQNPNFQQPAPNHDWVTNQPPVPPKAPNSKGKVIIPVAVGVAALLAGVGIGNSTSTSEPAPTETVTASPEPAPTVTETASAAIPQACLDGFTAADNIRQSAATSFYAVADHLQSDLDLFNNLTDAGIEAYAVEMDEFNAVLEEQATITEKAVADLETARAGCK